MKKNIINYDKTVNRRRYLMTVLKRLEKDKRPMVPAKLYELMHNRFKISQRTFQRDIKFLKDNGYISKDRVKITKKTKSLKKNIKRAYKTNVLDFYEGNRKAKKTVLKQPIKNKQKSDNGIIKNEYVPMPKEQMTPEQILFIEKRMNKLNKYSSTENENERDKRKIV